MSDTECLVEEIKAIGSSEEQKLFLRILRNQGVLINKGTKEKPNWMFTPGSCRKHPRGCSAPTPQ